MKTKSTNRFFTLVFITTIGLLIPLFSLSQNLLINSDLSSGNAAWVLQGMNVEVNSENVYGGASSTNYTAEIDAFAGLRQKMPVITGKIYTIRFKASRRTTGVTPATVGILLKIKGATSSTIYINFTKNYSNTVFGYSDEEQTFAVPATSTDRTVIVEFVHFNNSTSHGVILDDIEMIATGTSSLPVQWISFTGEIKNEQTLLNWKTAAETNNKHFVIERSANGNQYESIGTVSAGTSNWVNSYSFTDAKLKAGTNFYRLRQVDADGAYKYSKVVIVRLQKGNEAIKVFPTIATSTINFNLSTANATNAIVSIYDTNGKMMIRSQKSLTAGANQQGVDVSNLSSGAYYIRIQNNEGSINYSQAFHKVD